MDQQVVITALFTIEKVYYWKGRVRQSRHYLEKEMHHRWSTKWLELATPLLVPLVTQVAQIFNNDRNSAENSVNALQIEI